MLLLHTCFLTVARVVYDLAVVVVVIVVLIVAAGTNGNHTPFQNNSEDGDLILLASFQW